MGGKQPFAADANVSDDFRKADIRIKWALAYASYLLGETEEAKHWTNIATAFDLDHRVLICNLACLHSLLGSIDNALATLERSLNIPSNPEEVNYARNVDPDLALVRKDPRFGELFARYMD